MIFATAFFAKTMDTSDKMLARPENDVQSTRTSFVFAMGKRKGRGGARENGPCAVWSERAR